MKNLIKFIQSKITLSNQELESIKKCFITEEISAGIHLLKPGLIEKYIYFLDDGIVKGYQNIDGKIVIQHLVTLQNIFTSLESFMTQTPSSDYFETITDCRILKISKTNFDRLQNESKLWSVFVTDITNEHLQCKQERVKDFQTLTAKERYLKFLNQYPKLASQVSVENMASFLGMEPQSLSRIRKQITF